MDIKSLQIIVAIADFGSFQTAAKHLNMSVSNVSLQISALEKQAGLLFFDRGFRPPQLTDAGIEFIAQARALLIEWDNLNQNLTRHGSRGAIKIGAVHTAVAGGVSLALGNLRKQQPDLFIQLHTALTTDLIKQVGNQTIDCAVITEPPHPITGMKFVQIAREELGVIAHQSTPGKNYREILRTNPYLRFNRAATLAQRIDAELKHRNIEVNATMEIATLDAIESLVKNGLGVSVVPIGENVRPLPKEMIALPFKSPQFFRSLGLLMNEQSPRQHLIDMLLDALKKVYRSNS